MDPNAFIAEVYRRMAARHAAGIARATWHEMENNPMVLQVVHQYKPYLPQDRTAPILELGIGDGWFIAACLKLGYQKIYGADFGITHKHNIRAWAPDCVTLFDIPSDIGEFLSDKEEQFQFIHLSHVIEHISKYSLFWIVDALYRALQHGGSILMRTPNMEGPSANSSFYVTLSYEYGFSGSNLISLLDLCGFDDVRLLTAPTVCQDFEATGRPSVARALSDGKSTAASAVRSESGRTVRCRVGRNWPAGFVASVFRSPLQVV